MAIYFFEYDLPKGYYLKIVDHYEDTDYTRAYLYKGRHSFQKLINITDFENGTSKLEVVKNSVDFIGLLENKKNLDIKKR